MARLCLFLISLAPVGLKPRQSGSVQTQPFLFYHSFTIIHIKFQVLSVFDPVAFPGYLYDLCTAEEAIEYCRGSRHVSYELTPVLQRPVGGHDGRAQFVSTHDYL